MNRRNYSLIQGYNFSSYEIVTGDELYLINGGKKVDNTNAGVAGAKPGDTVTREDETNVTLTQADIDWAKDQLGGDSTLSEPDSDTPSSTPSGTNPSTPSSYQPSVPLEFTPISTENDNETNYDSDSNTYNFSNPIDNSLNPEPTEGLFNIDHENMTVQAKVNNLKSCAAAYNAYYLLESKGYSYQLVDGKDVIHTFTSDDSIKKYINTMDKSESNFFETMGTVSTATGVLNVVLDKVLENVDDASKFSKLSNFSNTTGLISFVTGGLTVVPDIKKAISNPTIDTVSDSVIDIIGLIPGGTLYSVGLSLTKQGIKETYEGIQEGIGYQRNYIFSELKSSITNTVPAPDDYNYWIMKSFNMEFKHFMGNLK